MCVIRRGRTQRAAGTVGRRAMLWETGFPVQRSGDVETVRFLGTITTGQPKL